MGRYWKAAIFVMAVALAGCSQPAPKTSGGVVGDETAPTGAQTYRVEVDASSPDGKNLQLSGYFPMRVRVRPGDTVIFENRSTQSAHTVTFGVAPFDPAAPFPVTKAGLANPMVFEPCYLAEDPPVGAEACPTAPPAAPPAFTGSGFWNSGAIAPMTASTETPHAVVMKVAAETEPNIYTYGDLIHPGMAAAIEVVENDTDRISPAASTKDAEEQRTQSLATASRLTDPAPAPSAGGALVAAGWGSHVTSVNRFSPGVVTIKPGQSVTWEAQSPTEPHTVTFESPYKTAGDPGVFTAGGVKAGGRYQGGFAHSGLIGAQPWPAKSFSLVFTKPGTYSYSCALHPGMTGQVVVTG